MSVSRGRCGTWRHPPLFRLAGVALGHIHRRFVWQMWHLWHWAGSGALGRAGARLVAGDAAQLCLAGVSLGDIHLRFAWQVCGTWSHSLSFRVAGVALMALGFVLRGRRGTYGTGLALVARWGALGHAWSPMTPPNFAWQSWHLATSIFVSRGCGTCLHPPAFCVAGVALGHFHFGTWRHPPSFRVAGVALGDIHLRFAWQVCGTWSHSLSFRVARVARMALVARLGALGHAWSPMTPPNFAWQAWHLATSSFVSRGCGTCLHPPAFCVAWSLPCSWRHPPSFRVAGLELGHIHLIIVLRGRRGIYGTGLALVARWGALVRR